MYDIGLIGEETSTVSTHHEYDFGPIIFLICLFAGTFIFFMCVYACVNITQWICKRRFRKHYQSQHVRFHTMTSPNSPSLETNNNHISPFEMNFAKESLPKTNYTQKPTLIFDHPSQGNKSVIDIENFPSQGNKIMQSSSTKFIVMAVMIEVISLNRMQKCYLYLQEVKPNEYQKISHV